MSLSIEQGKRRLRPTGFQLGGLKFHVWTLAVCKGFLVLMSTGWVRSCIRPSNAADLAAGPDEIRGSTPYHGIAHVSAWN